MEKLHINLEFDVCVGEDNYEECYDYLQEMRSKITGEVLMKYQGTSESHLY